MNVCGSSRSVHIDMDRMVSFMTRQIDFVWSLYDQAHNGINMCPIYRVPKHIREINHVAYEPIVISFGPYHHGAQQLQTMEKQKWEHLDRVLKLNCERTLSDYIKAIAGVEKQARKCYSDEITMERKKFVQMLLLDACFLLVTIDEDVGTRVSDSRVVSVINLKESGAGVGHSRSRERGDATDLELDNVEASKERLGNIEVENVNHMANMENTDASAWHDVLLLENQIPFFVVETVYELVAGQGTVEMLRSKTVKFVEDIIGHYPKGIEEFDRSKYFHHLLHLCHMYFRPSQKTDQEHQYTPKTGYFHRLLQLGRNYFAVCHKSLDVEKNLEQMDCFQTEELWTRWRQAVEYHRAGVRFSRREWDGESRHSLLDIRFMNGFIEVPCLPIDETTEPLFRNLIALEQTDPRFGNDFSSYVTFMSQVVATTDDATMFVQKGIILHMMDSDEEVSALFTRLTRQVTLSFDCEYYLKSLCQALEAHYQSRVNRWIDWLWLNHFVNPWLALAAFAAGVMLVCTIVQTVYTVLAYVKPP